jgi:hypothetical protein
VPTFLRQSSGTPSLDKVCLSEVSVEQLSRVGPKNSAQSPAKVDPWLNAIKTVTKRFVKTLFSMMRHVYMDDSDYSVKLMHYLVTDKT